MRVEKFLQQALAVDQETVDDHHPFYTMTLRKLEMVRHAMVMTEEGEKPL